MSDIHKPCIRQCCLNEDEVCLGCFRTFSDMLSWHKASIQEKKAMLQKAEMRKKEHAQKHASS